eukprot:COSAG06_NODE_55393_length_289_cov_2.931579_1_plen_63_part_01
MIVYVYSKLLKKGLFPQGMSFDFRLKLFIIFAVGKTNYYRPQASVHFARAFIYKRKMMKMNSS